MNFTDNPVVGSNSGDWGAILNTILDELKTACNTLDTTKALINHTHIIYATTSDLSVEQQRIDALESLVNFMNPDLSEVSVAASVRNGGNGIQVAIAVTPSVYVRMFNVEVKKNGAIIHAVQSGSNNIFISESVGFEDGDILEVRGQIICGQDTTKYSEWYSHTYNNAYPSLTVADVVAAFKNDESALQELANVLHDSNTLAQKVAELM